MTTNLKDLYYVRSLTHGMWRTVDMNDFNGRKFGEKVLVQVAPGEVGKWNVDRKPVDVIGGLVVSFTDPDDANYFISQGRANLVEVSPECVVVFQEEGDALFHVRAGLGEMLSTRERDQLLADMDLAHRRAEQEARNAEAGGDGEQVDEPAEGEFATVEIQGGARGGKSTAGRGGRGRRKAA